MRALAAARAATMTSKSVVAKLIQLSGRTANRTTFTRQLKGALMRLKRGGEVTLARFRMTSALQEAAAV
jgi:hypothetical protein